VSRTRGGLQDRARCERFACGNVCETRRAREVVRSANRRTTVRPTRLAARIRCVTRSTRPTRNVSTASVVIGPAPERHACDPIDRRRSAYLDRPADRGCGRARTGAGPTRGPSSDTRIRSCSAATSPHGDDPRGKWKLRRGLAADAPEPFDRQRVEETPAPRRGGTTSSPSGFENRAPRPWRENFVRATPHGDRQSEPGRRRRGGAGPRSPSVFPDHAPETADIQERLVDREALDERRRVSRTPRITALLASMYAENRGGDDDRPAGTAVAPGAADPSRSARRSAWPRSSRPERRHPHRTSTGRPAQPGLVHAVSNRGEERVEVGVEDRRIGHEHMFVPWGDRGATRQTGVLDFDCYRRVARMASVSTSTESRDRPRFAREVQGGAPTRAARRSQAPFARSRTRGRELDHDPAPVRSGRGRNGATTRPPPRPVEGERPCPRWFRPSTALIAVGAPAPTGRAPDHR